MPNLINRVVRRKRLILIRRRTHPCNLIGLKHCGGRLYLFPIARLWRCWARFASFLSDANKLQRRWRYYHTHEQYGHSSDPRLPCWNSLQISTDSLVQINELEKESTSKLLTKKVNARRWLCSTCRCETSTHSRGYGPNSRGLSLRGCDIGILGRYDWKENVNHSTFYHRKPDPSRNRTVRIKGHVRTETKRYEAAWAV